MKSKALLLSALLFANPFIAFGALEFSGFMSDSRAVRFVLTDSASGAHSEWLAIGQSFQNFTIVDFDRKSEVLVVRRDSQTSRLPLQAPKTRDGAAVLGPSTILLSVGGQSSISVRDDPTLLGALEAELQLAATLTPQPTVTIRASKNTDFSVLRAAFELCRKCGLQKISLSPP